MGEEYNYISNEFKHNGHYWKATDEYCPCGDDWVVLRRTGFETDLNNLPPNTTLKTKICLPKSKIRDKLI